MSLLYPNWDTFDSLSQTLAIHCSRPMDQGDSVTGLRACTSVAVS